MKYSLNILINKPLDHVISEFDNPENLSKWMEGLQSIETISGEPGKVGAKSKMIFKMGKKDIEMIETIKRIEFPHLFVATYEAKGVFNVIENMFEKVERNVTKYTTLQEFRFKGFMKVIAFLFPGSFKKQSLKYLEDFKNFVENQ